MPAIFVKEKSFVQDIWVFENIVHFLPALSGIRPTRLLRMGILAFLPCGAVFRCVAVVSAQLAPQ